jgi:hypothetical protein
MLGRDCDTLCLHLPLFVPRETFGASEYVALCGNPERPELPGRARVTVGKRHQGQGRRCVE